MTKSEKSCRHEKLMGSQTPSDRIVPYYAYTDGPDAVKVLAVGKLIVDPWQSEVLNDWMGRTEDDVWSAPTCGLSVPRQNGKTLDTSGRIASGMILYAEWVIYTAHLQKTATETFMELRGLFESRGLRKYVKEIKAALGREQIILKNGGRVVFVARTVIVLCSMRHRNLQANNRLHSCRQYQHPEIHRRFIWEHHRMRIAQVQYFGKSENGQQKARANPRPGQDIP